jgi:hypothetical protein
VVTIAFSHVASHGLAAIFTSWTVTPVASVAIGIGLLGETPRTGVADGIAAGFAVLVTSLALACLARSVPHPERRSQGPADGARGGLAVLSGAVPSR